MSEFEFGCPKCNERLVAPEKLRGQSVNCPQCGCELIAEEDIDYDKTQTHQAENKSSAAKEALDFSEENKNHQDKQEEKTSGHHESSMGSPSSFPERDLPADCHDSCPDDICVQVLCMLF